MRNQETYFNIIFIMQNDILINTIFRIVFLFYKYTFLKVFKYINIWDFNLSAEIKDQHCFSFLYLALLSEAEMKED